MANSAHIILRITQVIGMGLPPLLQNILSMKGTTVLYDCPCRLIQAPNYIGAPVLYRTGPDPLT